MVFLAIALILVASALLFSTLQQLVYGDLTIDVRVRAVLLRRAAGEGHVRGQRYFWVPIADHPEQGVVVASAAHEQPYDLGSWTENMRAFLWYVRNTGMALVLVLTLPALFQFASLHSTRDAASVAHFFCY
jgi:hypothetical protein